MLSSLQTEGKTRVLFVYFSLERGKKIRHYTLLLESVVIGKERLIDLTGMFSHNGGNKNSILVSWSTHLLRYRDTFHVS